jgi:glycosyltransferase involved in cell wall biosynthesis
VPPLVSVIIPAYNASVTIERTLRSVLAQTHGHLEIIVVDDGSIDDTAAIVERISREDPRIILLQQPNQGVATARNVSIDHARGEFIAPLDADDIWHPSKIEKQIAVIKGGRSDRARLLLFEIHQRGRHYCLPRWAARPRARRRLLPAGLSKLRGKREFAARPALPSTGGRCL